MSVPKLRFKEFDGDWDFNKIGEIFKVTSGSTPLRSDKRFFENAHIPWVKTTDLNNSFISETEEMISEIALKETSVKILPKGTVFVAMYGGFNQIGRTGLLLDESACNQALSAIYPNEKIDSFFLLTYLNHKVDDWKNFAASSRKDPNITKSDVLAFSLVYPTKKEQTKIASFLSAVDEKISKLTQKHELLSQYKQGMMQKLFSQQIRFKADDGSEFGAWEEKLLSEIGFFKNGLNKDKESFGFGFPFVNLMDVFGKKIVEIDNLGLVDANQKDLENYDLKKGDVLFIRSSVKAEGVGQTALVLNDLDNTVYSGFLIRFRDTYGLDLGFKKYCFMNNEFRLKLLAKSTTSANTNINQESLCALSIKVPCLEEQTKIANFLSSIDQKIEVVAQQLEHAKQWKKGLLQQMFV